MSWADAAPVVKVVHNAKASIDIDVAGRAKLNITFSEPFFRELGAPKKCNIQAGQGENLGKIRLVPHKAGAFDVREYDRGGGKVQMILPEGFALRNRETEPCELIERPTSIEEACVVPLPEGAAWILQLPMAAWDRQGTRPAPPPAAPKPQAPAPQAQQRSVAATVHTSTRPLDAAEYLKKNGVRCSRMAGEWWQLDGQRVPRLEVLARVNEIRRRNELPALGIDNIE